jgi:hypothetical protein
MYGKVHICKSIVTGIVFVGRAFQDVDHFDGGRIFVEVFDASETYPS